MNKFLEENALIIGGLGLALFVAIYYVKKNGVQGISSDIASAGVDVVNGLFTGAVEGVGETIGIPRTNLTQCQQDMAAGNKWDASFSCEAMTYAKWLARGAPSSASSRTPPFVPTKTYNPLDVFSSL